MSISVLDKDLIRLVDNFAMFRWPLIERVLNNRF
jgi:hypothetical protein